MSESSASDLAFHLLDGGLRGGGCESADFENEGVVTALEAASCAFQIFDAWRAEDTESEGAGPLFGLKDFARSELKGLPGLVGDLKFGAEQLRCRGDFGL